MVRLSGTNSDKGKEILNDYAKKNSNFKILTADNLDDAAKKAVSTLKKWINYIIFIKLVFFLSWTQA